MDFPGGSDGKVSAYHAGDPGSIPGLGRSSGEGNGNPLHYSCLLSGILKLLFHCPLAYIVSNKKSAIRLVAILENNLSSHFDNLIIFLFISNVLQFHCNISQYRFISFIFTLGSTFSI